MVSHQISSYCIILCFHIYLSWRAGSLHVALYMYSKYFYFDFRIRCLRMASHLMLMYADYADVHFLSLAFQHKCSGRSWAHEPVLYRDRNVHDTTAPAVYSLWFGRSPADFRLSQLRFVKSRLRFAWLSPGYVWTQSFLFKKTQKRNRIWRVIQKVMVESRQVFCLPSWPCSLGDRGAESGKRAEWAWCSWSTGWLQVWRRNACRECACGCEHKNTAGTISCTQILYWVIVGCGVEWGKKSVANQFAVKYM